MARILITDDSETIRELMKEILKSGGHTIVGEAVDGKEAVSMFNELHPDITTLDIAMPVMDGMEALSQIMETDPDAKILMVSSASQDGNIPKSMIYGAIEFIEKPFDAEQLLTIIAKIENASAAKT